MWFPLSKTLRGGNFRQRLFGYARVANADQNSADQNPAHQTDALVRAGIDAANTHTDHAGGAKTSRPQLDMVLGDCAAATPW